MNTPKEIYLFPYDDSIVWADTDETPDQQGVKYIRADQINEIKAEAIAEVLAKAIIDLEYYDRDFIDDLQIQINQLRGEK